MIIFLIIAILGDILGGAVTIAVIFLFVFAFAFSIVGTVLEVFAFAVTGIFALACTFAFAIAITGAIAIVLNISFADVITETTIFAIAGAFTLTGFYIGLRAIKEGDVRDNMVRDFAVAFAATGGTNFQDADLTDATFTRATLKNTDFSNAILTRTCFRNAKQLDLARPGKTYLKNLKLQQWLMVTG